jgi:hypothetical protein
MSVEALLDDPTGRPPAGHRRFEFFVPCLVAPILHDLLTRTHGTEKDIADAQLPVANLWRCLRKRRRILARTRAGSSDTVVSMTPDRSSLAPLSATGPGSTWQW